MTDPDNAYAWFLSSCYNAIIKDKEAFISDCEVILKKETLNSYLRENLNFAYKYYRGHFNNKLTDMDIYSIIHSSKSNNRLMLYSTFLRALHTIAKEFDDINNNKANLIKKIIKFGSDDFSDLATATFLCNYKEQEVFDEAKKKQCKLAYELSDSERYKSLVGTERYINKWLENGEFAALIYFLN